MIQPEMTKSLRAVEAVPNVQSSMGARAAIGFKVKGIVFSQALAFIEREGGKEGKDRLLSSLGTKMPNPLMDFGWYSFVLYDQLLRGIADEVYNGGFRRLSALGEQMASYLLEGPYKIYATNRDLEAFFERLPTLYGNLFSEGHIASEQGVHGTWVHILGQPATSEPDHHLFSGFFKACGHQVGTKVRRVESSIDARGAHYRLIF